MPQQMAFYNSNPVISNKNTSQLNVDENNNPQEQQQQLAIQSFQSNQNIEPSAENGFHIRFQIAAPMASEAVTKASSTHIHRGKKNNFFSELYFKNKVKHRLPKRKITYNTALCSRF